MALSDKIINVGTVAGDGTGDKGQVPFSKYNAAVTELYGDVASLQAGVSGFVFTQSAPLATWLIAHNLNRFPGVITTDVNGNQVEADVRYVDANHVQVTFSIPFAGMAYLS